MGRGADREPAVRGRGLGYWPRRRCGSGRACSACRAARRRWQHGLGRWQRRGRSFRAPGALGTRPVWIDLQGPRPFAIRGVARGRASRRIAGVGSACRRAADTARTTRAASAASQSWSHPNLVKLLDFGRDGAKLFLSTELLEGASLRVVLDDNAPEPLAYHEVLGVLRAVGDALNYAHVKGIVHGDVRPRTSS